MAYYDRELAQFGITANQSYVLAILEAKDGLSLGEFAQRAKCGKAAAVTMVDRLEAIGLVRREPDPDDARLNRIVVTDKTRELFPKVDETVDRLEKAIEDAIGEDNLKNLIESLSIIRRMDL